MIDKIQQRPEPKRRHDRRQTDIVQKLMDERLLVTKRGKGYVS